MSVTTLNSKFNAIFFECTPNMDEKSIRVTKTFVVKYPNMESDQLCFEFITTSLACPTNFISNFENNFNPASWESAQNFFQFRKCLTRMNTEVYHLLVTCYTKHIDNPLLRRVSNVSSTFLIKVEHSLGSGASPVSIAQALNTKRIIASRSTKTFVNS